MELPEARKRLASVLKATVERLEFFIKTKVKPFERALQGHGKQSTLQDAIKKDYMKRYGLSGEEYDKLYMFFSPLRVFEKLSEAQARFCIELHDEIYPNQTLFRDGLLIKLYEAQKSKRALSLGDDFSEVLRKVWKVKLSLKAEMQRINEQWRAYLKSMSVTEREEFLRIYGDRLPFLRNLDID